MRERAASSPTKIPSEWLWYHIQKTKDGHALPVLTFPLCKKNQVLVINAYDKR